MLRLPGTAAKARFAEIGDATGLWEVLIDRLGNTPPARRCALAPPKPTCGAPRLASSESRASRALGRQTSCCRVVEL